MPKDVQQPIVRIVDRFLDTIQQFAGLIEAILSQPNRSDCVDSTVGIVSTRRQNRHSSFEVPNCLLEMPAETKQISVIGEARPQCNRDTRLFG